MMFTKEQGQELIDNTTSEWITLNNTNGRKFINKTDTSKYIFLPTGGAWAGASLINSVSYAYYWCTAYSSYNNRAFTLHFYSTGIQMDDYGRMNGYTMHAVRPLEW